MDKKLGEVIKARLRAMGKSQEWLAEEVGVSNAAVSKWMGSGKISKLNAQKVAHTLSLTLNELFGVPEPANNLKQVPENSGHRPIPVINRIPAGPIKEIVDSYHAGAGMETITPDVEVGPYAFGLIIDGDSMEPRFFTGDKVIIDPSVVPRPGDFVAFKYSNGHQDEYGSTFKQYRPRGLNSEGVEYYELVPLNQNHPTIRSDQVECVICGTMVEHRTYRRTRN